MRRSSARFDSAQRPCWEVASERLSSVPATRSGQEEAATCRPPGVKGRRYLTLARRTVRRDHASHAHEGLRHGRGAPAPLGLHGKRPPDSQGVVSHSDPVSRCVIESDAWCCIASPGQRIVPHHSGGGTRLPVRPSVSSCTGPERLSRCCALGHRCVVHRKTSEQVRRRRHLCRGSGRKRCQDSVGIGTRRAGAGPEPSIPGPVTGYPRLRLPWPVAAALIETQDLMEDEAVRALWFDLDDSQRNALLVWVNTPRLSWRRRRRTRLAIVAIREGATRPTKIRPDFLGGAVDPVLSFLLPW